MSADKKRWQYRFENYERAYFLLRDAVKEGRKGALNQLQKEGLIRRFGRCTELAWGTLKDYLESQGLVLEQTPRVVLKEAVAAVVVSQGRDWMDLLDSRNAISHTYNFGTFNRVIGEIEKRYLARFDELYAMLSEANTQETCEQ